MEGIRFGPAGTEGFAVFLRAVVSEHFESRTPVVSNNSQSVRQAQTRI